jgi:hypothetical protein
MKKIILAATILACVGSQVQTAKAGGWGLAAGVLGGVAAGTIIGESIARAPVYYAAPPAYYYPPPAPAYRTAPPVVYPYAPAVAYPAPAYSYYAPAPVVAFGFGYRPYYHSYNPRPFYHGYPGRW